jgi:hypothetical protein
MRKILLVALSLLAMKGVCFAQIVFTEDFEEASLEEIFTRWDEVSNPNQMSISDDVPPTSGGSQSLMITAIGGQDAGGHLYKMFADGYDSLFARFYVKFAPSHHAVHHLVHMGGYNPPTPWPQGGAGERPDGTERFTTGIEPMGERWEWDFYTYWMHMRGNPDPGTYWGNSFNPDPPVPVVRGEWICVEIMMKCNNPVDSYDGEQTFWINGERAIHLGEGFPNGYWVWDSFYPHPDSAAFEGFQWRIVEDLKINFFWLLYYMTGGDPGQVDTVWFDDVVVSTEYIGEIVGIDEKAARPEHPALVHAYPNPFNSKVMVKYYVDAPGRTTVTVYSLTGRRIAVLSDGFSEAGSHHIAWDAVGYSSGIYLLHFVNSHDATSIKMVLLK